jgi:hypothetical protein
LRCSAQVEALIYLQSDLFFGFNHQHMGSICSYLPIPSDNFIFTAEISEDDYALIASGIVDKVMPPQPIEEDEEKELSILSQLDVELTSIVQMCDTTAARARQTKHRFGERRRAIISRKEAFGNPQGDVRIASGSPPAINGQMVSHYSHASGHQGIATTSRISSPPSSRSGTAYPSQPSQQSGFVAVNGRSSQGTNILDAPGRQDSDTPKPQSAIHTASPQTSSAASRNTRRQSQPAYNASDDPANLQYSSAPRQTNPPTVQIPATPQSLLHPTNNTPASTTPVLADDGGPYKAMMVKRMESMPKGERVNPPCDRCRRLGMDCMKNLSACAGCTKKHTKCSWRDIKPGELDLDTAPERDLELQDVNGGEELEGERDRLREGAGDDRSGTAIEKNRESDVGSLTGTHTAPAPMPRGPEGLLGRETPQTQAMAQHG